MKKRLASLLEQLGIDWLPELFGKRCFDVEPPPFEVSDEKLDEAIGHLDSEDSICRTVEEVSEAFDQETQRINTIEDKAKWLFSASSLPSAVALAGIGYFSSLVGLSPAAAIWLAIFLLSLSLVALLFTALLSWKTLHIHDYVFQTPSPKAVLSIGELGVDRFFKEKAKALFSALCWNTTVANVKGTYLGGAQLWFRNSVILILLAVILVPALLVIQMGWEKPAPEIEVYFGYPGSSSPYDQNPEQQITDLLATLGEGDSVGLALHYFSDTNLRRAVYDALLQGAVVRLVIEGDNVNAMQESALSYEDLAFAGDFAYRVDNPPSYRMHHKYMVIQGETALSGSYNWSESADSKAWENILVISDPSVVDLYWQDFERLWQDFSDAPHQSPSHILDETSL
jgi:hypothetical protein